MPAKICLIGKQFGRLKVISEATPTTYKCGSRNSRSVCCCKCGNIVVVLNMLLRNGKTKSCGCFRKQIWKKLFRRHCHTLNYKSTKTYCSWAHMIQRCTNPKNKRWKYYGARGISVCRRWRKFDNFLADIGEKPAGLQLDRIDVDGDYTPSNCRWATVSQQMKNRRPFKRRKPAR